MRKQNSKLTIGYIDHLAMPEFGLDRVACKIDTGAYTSTLHCSSVRMIEENGQSQLCFKLYDPKFGIITQREFSFSEYNERRVRSSNGQVETRYSIHTTLVLFGKDYRTEFTLSSREQMRFPILLGRRFLRKRFVVDVALKNLSFKREKNNL